MKNYRLAFSVLAGMLTVAAYICLVYEWKKGWKPQRATWSIWIVVTGIISASMLVEHSYKTAVIPIVYFFGTTTIAILSFKRGVGGWEPTDKLCLTIATLGMIAWIFTGDPATALFLNILADACAGVPTIKKLLKFPKSESAIGWGLFCLGATVGIFSAESYGFVTIGYPIFAALFTAGMTLLTFRRKPL